MDNSTLNRWLAETLGETPDVPDYCGDIATARHTLERARLHGLVVMIDAADLDQPRAIAEAVARAVEADMHKALDASPGGFFP